jgi:rusticyanin
MPGLSRRRRARGHIWVALAAAVVVAIASGFAIGRAAQPAADRAASAFAPATPPRLAGMVSSVRCRGRAKTHPMNNMNTPDASLGQFIGREAGTAMAGNGPITVSAAQVARLGNQVPVGAHIDTCNDHVTFSTSTVSMVVEAAPPNNPDMTFRIAGLVNPTVVVPRGAEVEIEFINADNDEAHALVITSDAPPYPLRTGAMPAFPGAAAAPIGDPTSAGQGAEDFSFVATTPGTYHYVCPMPGHAEMGMAGLFLVR